MAKDKIYGMTNHYANQDEQIRKAKGNPNKNHHSKKKNSNYGGYNATGTGAYVANKISQKAANREKVQLPLGAKIALGVLFGAVIVTLILRMAVFPDSLASVAEKAFANCSNLNEVELSRNTQVKWGAFGRTQIRRR